MSVQVICQRCRQAFHMPKVIGNLCKPCFRLKQEEIAAEKHRSEMAEDKVVDMDSKDRELLELAAKAGGIPGEWCEFTIADTGKVITGIGDPCSFRAYGDRLWNPLEDDGDALRLAVSLGLQVYGREIGCSVDDYVFVDEQDCGGDKYAASRRAIVLAAAEIGKTK